MDRRQFLEQLLCAGAAAAAPKFIFDMGANLYKRKGWTFEEGPTIYRGNVDPNEEITLVTAPRLISFEGIKMYLNGTEPIVLNLDRLRR